MAKFIKFLFFAVLAGVIIYFIADKYNFIHTSNKSVSSVSSTIVKEILPVSKYVTLEHNYQTTEEYKKDDSEVYFTILKIKKTQRLVYSFNGTLKLGINGEKIEVVQSGDKIQIIMPPIEVISNDIDLGNIKFYADEKSFFASPLTKEQVNHLIEDKRTEIALETLKDKKIIDDAKESAQNMIMKLLQNIAGIDEYKIDFIWQPQDGFSNEPSDRNFEIKNSEKLN